MMIIVDDRPTKSSWRDVLLHTSSGYICWFSLLVAELREEQTKFRLHSCEDGGCHLKGHKCKHSERCGLGNSWSVKSSGDENSLWLFSPSPLKYKKNLVASNMIWIQAGNCSWFWSRRRLPARPWTAKINVEIPVQEEIYYEEGHSVNKPLEDFIGDEGDTKLRWRTAHSCDRSLPESTEPFFSINFSCCIQSSRVGGLAGTCDHLCYIISEALLVKMGTQWGPKKPMFSKLAETSKFVEIKGKKWLTLDSGCIDFSRTLKH